MIRKHLEQLEDRANPATVASLFHRLWIDDHGAVISTELTMVLGIVVGGVGAGLATVRNNVNHQLQQVSALPDSVIPDAESLRAQVAVQPSSKQVRADSHSQSSSHAGANVSIVLNVQYPSQTILPPSP